MLRREGVVKVIFLVLLVIKLDGTQLNRRSLDLRLGLTRIKENGKLWWLRRIFKGLIVCTNDWMNYLKFLLVVSRLLASILNSNF